ncbi:uncharacterized protein LODBEIA_P06190 [Lodderomyces beijingensis]|uniref:J domain-containing protein n=1 Tax=Lodderomyces beijingensis TaxID=1775926 RepID=A0ABP0ZGV5_9ASCO
MSSLPAAFHYTSLGVTPSTPFDEIKRAYRKLSLKLHPDKTPDPKLHEKFKEVSAAYEIIRAYQEARMKLGTGPSSSSNSHHGAAAAPFTSAYNYAKNPHLNPFTQYHTEFYSRQSQSTKSTSANTNSQNGGNSSSYSYYHFYQKSQAQQKQAAEAAAAQAERLRQEMLERVKAEDELKKRREAARKEEEEEEEKEKQEELRRTQETIFKRRSSRRVSSQEKKRNGSMRSRTKVKAEVIGEPIEVASGSDAEYEAAKESRRSKVEAAHVTNEFLKSAHGLADDASRHYSASSKEKVPLFGNDNDNDYDNSGADENDNENYNENVDVSKPIHSKTRNTRSTSHSNRKRKEDIDVALDEETGFGISEIGENKKGKKKKKTVPTVYKLESSDEEKEDVSFMFVPETSAINSPLDSDHDHQHRPLPEEKNNHPSVQKTAQEDDDDSNCSSSATSFNNHASHPKTDNNFAEQEYAPFPMKPRQAPRAATASPTRPKSDRANQNSNNNPPFSQFSTPNSRGNTASSHKRAKHTTNDTPSAFEMNYMEKNLGTNLEEIDFQAMYDSLPDNQKRKEKTTTGASVSNPEHWQQRPREFVYTNGARVETLSTPMNANPVRGHPTSKPNLATGRKLNVLDMHASPNVLNFTAPAPPMANFDPTTITRERWQRYVDSITKYQQAFLQYKKLIVQYQYERTEKDLQHFDLINDVSDMANLNVYSQCLVRDLEVMVQFENSLRVFMSTMNIYGQNCHWVNMYKRNDPSKNEY